MANRKQEIRPGWSLAGLGVEFAAAVGGFCLLGWWIDRHWEIEGQWGLLICSLLGIIGGLYNLIRQALRAVGGARSGKDTTTPQSHDDG